MTFGIVLLYKYRCMKVLIGYMMFSSMTLLGVLGAELFAVAIEKYRIPIDWFTFVFGLYNFAVVGVTAIFYQNGIPPYITQGYLICSSVIISWQLSHFDTISTWTLLIMLGIYDLCAVLTPCGPLRYLVNLMSEEDSPDMPGLLYEAEIPQGLKRPVMSGRHTSGRDEGTDEGRDDGSNSPPSSMSAERYQQPTVESSESSDNAAPGRIPATASSGSSGYSSSSGDVEMSESMGNDREESSNVEVTEESSTTRTNGVNSADAAPEGPAPTVVVPFAVAKLYRLPLTSPPPFANKRTGSGVGNQQNSGISTSPLLQSDSVPEDDDSPTNSADETTAASPYVIPDSDYTPAHMRTEVEAILPRNGAKIVKQPRRRLRGEKEDRYAIYGAGGNLKRTLFVDRKNGKVYEDVQDDDDDSEHGGRFSNTIKLGLGDFIFYSVLVAKSAQYSFPCFISSFLVILAGLGGTLVLLAVYKHALPALPISIFLAVGFYVLVRFIVQPWIHIVMSAPFYV
ncbi:hypothetical protein ACHAWF_015809 [Thalassiosira exigua]